MEKPAFIGGSQRPRNVGKEVSGYLRRKCNLSPALGLVLCVPLIPVIAALYLLVRLTSPGPGFYSQVRLGRNGKRFTIYKLRSMVVNAEAKTGAVWAAEDDPRVTPVGRWLRKYHLDELPQILNVVVGDMCLVGPRPERPEIAAHLEDQIPQYRRRLEVKPGITGMAQIHLPPDSDIDSVRDKLSYDLTYLERGGLFLDLRVACATALKVVPGVAGLPLKVARCERFAQEAKQRRRSLSGGYLVQEDPYGVSWERSEDDFQLSTIG